MCPDKGLVRLLLLPRNYPVGLAGVLTPVFMGLLVERLTEWE